MILTDKDSVINQTFHREEHSFYYFLLIVLIMLITEVVSLYYVVSTVHSTFLMLSHSVPPYFYEICVVDILPISEMRIPGVGDDNLPTVT